MIYICVHNMIELSVYLFAHKTLYKYIMGTLCLLFVSWSFVCQFKIDMFFAPSHDDTESSFSNFITTRLGRM